MAEDEYKLTEEDFFDIVHDIAKKWLKKTNTPEGALKLYITKEYMMLFTNDKDREYEVYPNLKMADAYDKIKKYFKNKKKKKESQKESEKTPKGKQKGAVPQKGKGPKQESEIEKEEEPEKTPKGKQKGAVPKKGKEPKQEPEIEKAKGSPKESEKTPKGKQKGAVPQKGKGPKQEPEIEKEGNQEIEPENELKPKRQIRKTLTTVKSETVIYDDTKQ